jgi:hypothetical protein
MYINGLESATGPSHPKRMALPKGEIEATSLKNRVSLQSELKDEEFYLLRRFKWS